MASNTPIQLDKKTLLLNSSILKVKIRSMGICYNCLISYIFKETKHISLYDDFGPVKGVMNALSHWSDRGLRQIDI